MHGTVVASFEVSPKTLSFSLDHQHLQHMPLLCCAAVVSRLRQQILAQITVSLCMQNLYAWQYDLCKLPTMQKLILNKVVLNSSALNKISFNILWTIRTVTIQWVAFSLTDLFCVTCNAFIWTHYSQLVPSKSMAEIHREQSGNFSFAPQNQLIG